MTMDRVPTTYDRQIPRFFNVSIGALSGFYQASVLCENHLSPDSKDAVKTGLGILATMTALVLSLLFGSAKTVSMTQMPRAAI